jgi:hypothetical protein
MDPAAKPGNACLDLTHHLRRQEQCIALDCGKKLDDTGIGAPSLAVLRDDVCVNQVHGGLSNVGKCIVVEIGHFRQDLFKRAFLRRREQMAAQNFPMLGFSTPTVGCGLALQDIKISAKTA